MKKIKFLIIAACILLCGAFILTCDNNPGENIYTGVVSEGWTLEVIRDDFPVQFAEGISTLFGVQEVPGEYFQTYVLTNPYVRGNPLTGRVELTTNALGMQMPVMEDAKGYDPNLIWPSNRGAGAKIPKRIPVLKTVLGPNGANVEVVHLYGTLMQKGSESEDNNSWVQRTGNFNETFTASSPATDYRWCASWPTISLYATPTDEALKTFRDDGYGYSFWVKVNKNYFVYRTSIENWDYRVRESYEPKHYFGIVPGREPISGFNYTLTPVGEWKQITVIYDPDHPDYNMSVAQWVLMYGIEGMYPGDTDPGDIDFNLQKTVRIIWDISLPDNGGTEGTEFQENTISTGRHEYDIYFYDLRFLQY